MCCCQSAGVCAQSRLQGHQDRVGGLVQLGSAGVRGGFAVDQGVTGELPAWQLLVVEEEQGGGARGGQVTIGQQAGERLVQVTRENLAIGAEIDGLAVHRRSGGYRLAPRAGQRSDDRARVGLVFARLDHVRRQVVAAHQVRRLSAGQAGHLAGKITAC
jgi:hypothetical protein